MSIGLELYSQEVNSTKMALALPLQNEAMYRKALEVYTTAFELATEKFMQRLSVDLLLRP